MEKKADDIASFKVTQDLKDVRKRLKPGDIVVTSMGRPLETGSVLDRAKDRVFRTFSYSVNKDHAHTGIYVGGGKVVEMLNDKLHIRPVEKTVEKLDALVVRPQVAPAVKREAVTKSLELAGKGEKFKYENFPFFAQVYLAEKVKLPVNESLNKRIDQNTVMCSNFIAHAYKDVKFHPEKIRAVVMPKDLATSDKTKRVVLFQNPERHDAERRLKVSTIEPSIFGGFAKKVLEAARKEEGGEIEESDPVSPYRDSQLSKALYTEKNKTPNADKPPRADYARPPSYTKSASVGSAAARALASFNRERFQDELRKRLEPSKDVEIEGLDIAIRRPDSIIPGSAYLRPGKPGRPAGIAHGVHARRVRGGEDLGEGEMIQATSAMDRALTGE